MISCPDKQDPLVEQIYQGASNDCIMLDKLSIVTGETEKTAELLEVSWLRPGLNGCYIGGISGNSLGTDNMSQIADRLLSELAFGQFDRPLVSGKELENLLQVLNMVFISGAID